MNISIAMDANTHHDHDHAKHMGHSTMPPMATHAPEHHHDNVVVVGDNDMTSHHDHMMHDMGGNMSEHMMKMYFHFSSQATILFQGWQTSSWQTMLGSCIAVFVMAALYEGLKVGREFLLRRTSRSASYNAVPVNSNGEVGVRQPVKATGIRMLSLAHGLQTLLHLVQIVISYFLMLIFMTYNGWLCISVALGAATGYFFFSWKRPIVIDVNEHCH